MPRSFSSSLNGPSDDQLRPIISTASKKELQQSTCDLLKHAPDMDIDPARDHEIFAQLSLQKLFTRPSRKAE